MFVLPIQVSVDALKTSPLQSCAEFNWYISEVWQEFQGFINNMSVNLLQYISGTLLGCLVYFPPPQKKRF